MNKELIQLLNIIVYRLDKSLHNADQEYFDYKLGNESRSPNEILSHLVDVSAYGLRIIDSSMSIDKTGDILENLHSNLKIMKSILFKEELADETSKRLINGPLSDILTHIGQLAFLRRLQGNPIEHENFSKADI